MANNAELFDLQKTGRALYEAKKYATALDTFSRAIVLARKWSPSDAFTILDQCVAVHVKLGNIDLARKDAMSMIRTKRSDGRGYLRCGQLDRLQDNPSAALRWYEHGLKQVPHSDPLHSALKGQRDKTQILLDHKLILSNSRDPVSVLPAELLQFVVAFLDYIDAIRALRVSRAWNVTLLRLKPLTDTIDFRSAKKVINYKMMAAALKRLGPSPKVLIMKDLAGPAIGILRLNLERWRNYTQLQELTISSKLFGLELLPFEKYNLKSLTIGHGRVRDHMVVEILKACRSLEVARFVNISGCLSSHRDASWVDPLLCPTVRILELGGDGAHDSLAVYPTFFNYFPHLEELKCHRLKICHTDDPFDLSALTGLLKLSFAGCSICWWPILPPSIETWDNENTGTVLSLGAQGQIGKLGQLVKLRRLRFNRTSRPPPSNSFLPDAATQSITCLDLRNTSVEAVDGELFLHNLMLRKQLTNLRELAWGGLHDEQGALTTTLHSLPKLEILILFASRLPGAELILLLKRPDNCLRQITLIDCENISTDTIDWARDRGVTMHVKKILA